MMIVASVGSLGSSEDMLCGIAGTLAVNSGIPSSYESDWVHLNVGDVMMVGSRVLRMGGMCEIAHILACGYGVEAHGKTLQDHPGSLRMSLACRD